MNTPMGSTAATCASCGRAFNRDITNRGLEEFLGRVGISDEMINNLKTQFDKVDIDQYLDTAREYLQGSTRKAKEYAKDNPGKVAAGVAILVVGAGLLFTAMNRD